MCWTFKAIGKREAVKKKVENDTSLPATVKAVILDHLQEEPDAPNGVRVEGSGHRKEGEGSWRSGIDKIEVEPITILE
jgi:hypothetical protein